MSAKEEEKKTQVTLPDDLAKELRKFRIARLSKENENKVKAFVVKITVHEAETEKEDGKGEGEGDAKITTITMEKDEDLDDVDLTGEVVLEELAEALPTSSPRYIVIIFWKHYEDGRQTERLALINWVPPNSNPKQLTLHAMASKQFEKAVNANSVIEVREGAEGLDMDLLLDKTK